MRKNITLSVDEDLIRRARQQAARENTSLNQLFRRWLVEYVEGSAEAAEFYALMSRLDHVQPGKTLTRDGRLDDSRLCRRVHRKNCCNYYQVIRVIRRHVSRPIRA
ncbi:MAG: hypothetical protein A2Z16_09610 [Chloroflexi bacterium RBG_16_54_18]|nr:MAG: hypothetical protein A2Z16_09610 [Chloroflexi bacterium RBG_16_54_18]